MRFVVDANIVISTLLRSDGAVADVLLRSKPAPTFFVPEFVRVETSLHRDKIARLTGATTDLIAQVEEILLASMITVQAESIDGVHWERAHQLVAGIDPKDDHYVALALHLQCPLWTGDKKLIMGLRTKGFKQVHSTEEVRLLMKMK